MLDIQDNVRQVAQISYEGKKMINQQLEMIASTGIVDKYNIDGILDIIKMERLDAAAIQMNIDSKLFDNKTT